MKETINVEALTKGGPYSHAVISGNLIFISGQTGQAPGNSGDFSKQFENAIRKVVEILKACDSSLENCVKVSVYLAKGEDFKKLNELFGSYFPRNPPSRTTIIAAFALPEILVEIDVVATR